MDKGKGREPGIIGFTSSERQERAFNLPSLDAACNTTAELWPRRISPSDQPIPKPYNKRTFVTASLSADDSEKLGDLLFKVVDWIVGPHTIDLTTDELESHLFQPPAGTILLPADDQISLCPLSLIAQNSSYSRCADLVYIPGEHF